MSSAASPVFAAHLAGIRDQIRGAASGAGYPEAVMRKARLMLLDTVACMLAARSAPEVLGLEKTQSAMESGSFRFPDGLPLSVTGAAAVAAMAATWDEACEGLAQAHGRPGVPVVAVLLPMAVSRNASLGQTLHALVAGYEVGARAGAWLRIRPAMHVDGNWPALGVAAAVADFLGLAPAERQTALDIAACQLATSLYLPVASGANARNTYLPHSAWLGILAAASAAGGVSAPDDALTHYAGNFSAAGAQAAPAEDRFLLLDAYFKPHAAVRHVHYGAEAAARLREKLDGDTSGITAIRLRVYQEAITYCGNRAPLQPIQAQFSLSFGIAATLLHGGIEAPVYRDPAFRDAELRRLEALVTIEADEALTRAGARGASLTLRCGGATLEQSVGAVKGDPDLPMSEDEVREKFMRYASIAVDAARAGRFAGEILHADPSTSLGLIWRTLVAE